MGKECDQPQIAALTEALGIGVKIEYLDGSAKELQTYVCLPSTAQSSTHAPGNHTAANSSSGDSSPSKRSPESINTDALEPVLLHLLYRPGHYDILYPRQSGLSPMSSIAAHN